MSYETALQGGDSVESAIHYRNEYRELTGRTDRLIGCIMGLQWAGAILASLLIPGSCMGEFE